MKLNEQQRQIVAENMGLVGKVIKDRVHSPNQLGIYTYDDIFRLAASACVRLRLLIRAAVFQPTPIG